MHLQLHRQDLRIRAGLWCSHVARFVALDEAVTALVTLLAGATQDATVAHVAQDAAGREGRIHYQLLRSSTEPLTP